MDINKFDEEKEKIAYEEHMKSEGYIKVNGQWILGKYPNKKTIGYKNASPKKKD